MGSLFFKFAAFPPEEIQHLLTENTEFTPFFWPGDYKKI
jgi:hypothetical protein